MEVYTIGFTQKTARDFFEALKRAGIRKLMDVRISNESQLAAFTKKDDLQYFLEQLCHASYVHQPLLAPTKELLSQYRDKKMDWAAYEAEFLKLMRERQVEKVIKPSEFEQPTVLLCSEPTAQKCHRRLVVEYLGAAWGGLKVIHL